MKRMLMMIILFVLACQAEQKTVVVYVNGVNSDKSDTTSTQQVLQTRWDAYAASKGIASNVVFDWFYNQHTWWLGDLNEATRQLFGQYGTDLKAYYSDPALVESANDKVLRQLSAAEINTPGSQTNQFMLTLNNTTPSIYNEALLASAINRMSASDRTDLADLVTKLKSYITTGNKTVCLGHSQGNFFCNLAYQVIQRDFAATSYTLPNNNVLEVISVATPASYIADGRFQYVKYCRDIINMVPYSLNANYKSPSELAPCMPRSASFTGNLVSAIGGLVSWIINGAGVREHSMVASYLRPGSELLNQVMMLVENSLPQSGCGNDANCYLKDDFKSVDYTGNWLQTGDLQVAKNSSVRQVSGILEFSTRGYYVAAGGSSVYAPGKITLRTRRVFTGKFTAAVSINHIGGGQSIVRLKKASDDSSAITLNINNGPGQNSVMVTPAPSGAVLMSTATGFGGFRQIVFSKTDSQVSLSVGGVVWSVNSSDAISGYYLEVESFGDNTLQIKDLSVARTLPPTFSLQMAQSMVSVEAGKSAEFGFSVKSNNGYLGQVVVTAAGLPSGASAAPVSVTLSPNQTASGKFTVVMMSRVKPLSYDFTVTASGSGFKSDPVMQTLVITAPVVTPPPLVLSSVSVSPDPAVTGLVRITANGSGITTATSMELTGPYCSPCVPNAKVSQTATSLVMDAQLNNPGTFTVKLRDGSQLTAGKDFTVSASEKPNSLNETFQTDYATNWNMTVGSGSPLTAWEPGKLRLWASKSGASLTFVSKKTFTGPLVAEFTFSHYNYGRTSVFILPESGDQRLASVDLDTDDCDYLNFSVPGKSTDWKYAGSPYMNRKVTIRIEISGTTVKFYADGVLMETMTTTGSGPYRLAFAAGSVPWKSGDNITDFYSVTANAEGGTTVPPSSATGTVNISATKDGSPYSGNLSCVLVKPSGQQTINSVPVSLADQAAGNYSLSCSAPGGMTVSSISQSASQSLSAGGTLSFLVALKTNTTAPPPLSAASCAVSATSVAVGQSVTYTASWVGGSGSPGFNWSGYVSGTTRSINWAFSSPGVYSASVLVMDNGQQASANCPSVTVLAPLSVSWFSYSPDSPKTTDTITFSFTGTGFNSNTQVWVFGLNCSGGCQAGVVASSITPTSMKALAQLRNADNFQIKLRDGPTGNFILAGTVPVR